MNAIEIHEFEKRNMTTVEPAGKLLERPTGAFTMKRKNDTLLLEYTILPNCEYYDEENMCTFGIGHVAYGILNGEEIELLEETDFRIYATGPEGIPHDIWRATASNVLWFSRHDMSTEQMDALVSIYGPVNIHQINKNITSAKEIETEIKASDIVAVVAPIGLQSDFLKVADGIPVISCRNKRAFTQSQDGKEMKIEFVFNSWYEIDEIKVITHDL